MSTIYLIRHGLTDAVGKTLAGRLPAIHLNRAGREQAAALAQHLAHYPFDRIYSSPLERARETAAPLAQTLNLPIQISESLNEVDFGDWTGLAFSQLSSDERWSSWNSYRSGARVPNGECLLDVQSRVVSEIERLNQAHPNQTLALISHADVIKAALTFFLGIPLDLLQRFEISPGSISILRLDSSGPQVLLLNQVLEGFPWA